MRSVLEWIADGRLAAGSDPRCSVGPKSRGSALPCRAPRADDGERRRLHPCHVRRVLAVALVQAARACFDA